jgi:hypothetical protein
LATTMEENEFSHLLQLVTYPNPAADVSRISFVLEKSNHVNLKLYNDKGAEVKELLNANIESGVHQMEVNTSDLNAGLYVYRIVAGQLSQTKKLIIVK